MLIDNETKEKNKCNESENILAYALISAVPEQKCMQSSSTYSSISIPLAIFSF